MAGVISGITSWVSGLYGQSLAANVLILSIILAVASLFIWRFYKSISKRNLIRLNLSKYNTSEHPIMNKIFAMLLYLVEYIVVIPLLITFWYSALSLVMFLIASDVSVNGILFASAVIIGAIRILAYFHSEIAKDLAKMFPFIALSVFILSFESFGNAFNLDQMVSKIYEIPTYWGDILSFVFAVVIIEIVLRIVYTVYEFWRSEEEAAGEVVSKGDEEDEE